MTPWMLIWAGFFFFDALLQPPNRGGGAKVDEDHVKRDHKEWKKQRQPGQKIKDRDGFWEMDGGRNLGGLYGPQLDWSWLNEVPEGQKDWMVQGWQCLLPFRWTTSPTEKCMWMHVTQECATFMFNNDDQQTYKALLKKGKQLFRSTHLLQVKTLCVAVGCCYFVLKTNEKCASKGSKFGLHRLKL